MQLTFLSHKLFPLAIAGGMLSALAPIAATSAPPPLTIRTSISSTGEEGDASSLGGPVSVDGRFVAFDSSASNLVPGDNNEVQDVFLRDLKTGLTRRVSLGGAGNEGNGSSSVLALSNNGRFVTFLSEASNLVAGDNNGVADVFVRDLNKARTQRIFVNNAHEQGYPASNRFSVSANGRFVAFVSYASNLVEGDTNGALDVFVRDLKTGITRRASVDSSGVEGNSYSGLNDKPVLSADGRFVAFESYASNLVDGDTNGYEDVFVHDLKTGVTARVSVNSAGEEASGAGFDPGSNCGGGGYSLESYSPSISASGRFIAFLSEACNLVEVDNNADFISRGVDVFVHDLKTGETKLASIDPVAGDYSYFGSFTPRISDTGRFISFSSSSSNLVPGDINDTSDAFLSRMW